MIREKKKKNRNVKQDQEILYPLQSCILCITFAAYRRWASEDMNVSFWQNRKYLWNFLVRMRLCYLFIILIRFWNGITIIFQCDNCNAIRNVSNETAMDWVSFGARWRWSNSQPLSFSILEPDMYAIKALWCANCQHSLQEHFHGTREFQWLSHVSNCQ